MIKQWFLGLALVLTFVSVAQAGDARIAVASNFVKTMEQLAWQFEQTKGHRITLIVGSTGKHYAQIKQGAPFDAFFAADAKRPALLEEEGLAKPNSRFTYAVGKLVLWSNQKQLGTLEQALQDKKFQRLAIANPKLAPYGKAAEHVLTKAGLWRGLQGKLVRGENVGQTFQFVQTGNAELGFVAQSQVKAHKKGSFLEVPQTLYEPIQQQAVLLTDNPAALEFVQFVQQQAAQLVIREHGYNTL